MHLCISSREGNGNPLQYSFLENPMDRGAWWAAVHGVAKSRTQLSDFTFTFHFHAWRRKWEPTPVFLPGESQGQGTLVGCRLWSCTELDVSDLAAARWWQSDFALSFCRKDLFVKWSWKIEYWVGDRQTFRCFVKTLGVLHGGCHECPVWHKSEAN